MPLAGIKLVRQTFAEQLPKGWSVAQAYMSYKHEGGMEFQLLTFHVISPAGKPYTVVSDASRDDVNELATRTAKKFLEGLKNESPTGSDAPNSGQRSVDSEDKTNPGR